MEDVGAGKGAAACGRRVERLEANRALVAFRRSGNWRWKTMQFSHSSRWLCLVLTGLRAFRPPLLGRDAELLVATGLLLPVLRLAGFAAVGD